MYYEIRIRNTFCMMMKGVLYTDGFWGFLTSNLFFHCQQWIKSSFIDENDTSVGWTNLWPYLPPHFPQELSYS